MIKKYWNPIVKFFTSYMLYLVALGAIICLTIAYSCFSPDHWGRDLFKSVGLTLVTGGVFAVILKSEQFSKIFHDELRKIIYSDEHLDIREDLEEIWEKVTKALSKQKFPSISKRMQENIKKNFLPVEHEYYYNDTKIKIDIELDPENNDYLIVKERQSTVMIADEGLDTISYRFMSGIPFDPLNKEATTYDLTLLKVNGKEIDVKGILEKKYDAKNLIVCLEYKLTGKPKYTVVREETKRYNLKLNNHRRHLAVWVYNNCFLDLHYPKELNIEFYNFGVLNDWKLEITNNRYNRIEGSYKGLIYKNQGFMLYLNKN